MGFGDVLMSIGEAKRMHAKHNLPIMITDQHGRPIQSPLFDGVPYLVTKPAKAAYKRHINCPGVRPYIAGKTATHWKWRNYKPEPADIVFTPQELAFAEPYRGSIMVEPEVKAIGHHNKDWGPIKWQQLDCAIHLAGKKMPPVIQCIKPGTRHLLYAQPVVTNTFRLTAAVLSVCRAFVGPEGGLHHAAAAVGVPAVVLFGGFISPDQTGYSTHRNLFTGGKPCGSRVECSHCRDAMVKITAAMVFDELKEILK